MDDPMLTLTDEERAAVRSAATWYANYHARDVADQAGDASAYALEERRRFLALVSGLGKLGVGFPLPDELAERRPRAA